MKHFKKIKHIALSGLGFCISLLSTDVQAQNKPLDTTLFKSMEYRVAGPYRGGRSIGIAGHADRQNEYYFGATGGGLWKTTDGHLAAKSVP